MSRYAPKAGWIADVVCSDDFPMLPELTLPESQPVDTGLLYPSGEPIMRLPNPIGFGRDNEW